MYLPGVVVKEFAADKLKLTIPPKPTYTDVDIVNY